MKVISSECEVSFLTSRSFLMIKRPGSRKVSAGYMILGYKDTRYRTNQGTCTDCTCWYLYLVAGTIPSMVKWRGHQTSDISRRARVKSLTLFLPSRCDTGTSLFSTPTYPPTHRPTTKPALAGYRRHIPTLQPTTSPLVYQPTI